ncbi:MAG: hypothetical protein ACLSAF_07590 [Intestinimonas sp.]
MDMPVNESEVIANVNASRELLSPAPCWPTIPGWPTWSGSCGNERR